MPAYIVTMNVDGEVVVETVIGVKDAQEAIKKAKDRHQTLVLGVAPLEVQMDLDEVRPEDHPGQTDLTRDLDDRPDLAMEMAPPLPDQPEDQDWEEDDLRRDSSPFPETTPDGPFEEAAANPFDESVPDPEHAEAVLAEMRGVDGSDEDGFDS